MNYLSSSCSLLLMAALVSFASCVDESEELKSQCGELVKSLSATVSDFELGEDEITRTSYVVSPTEGFVFSWSLGDTLGIYPVGGNQVDFPISDGVGTKTAMFDGGSWSLRSSYTYAGYYPYSANHYHNPQTAIPVSYTGQTQSGNNDLTGLSKYDYMAAAPVSATSGGGVNLELVHLGSFVRFQLTMPSAGNYTSMTLTSSDVKFVETATYDLTSNAPVLTPKSYSETFALTLENISTASANQLITLYAMIAPVSQKTSDNITVRVADDQGNTYSKVTTGKNLIAGKSYNYTLTLESDGGTGGTGSDAGWDDDDTPNMHNGHEYVDLGLPSGLKWATCNVGATTPEGYGDYFAWGDPEPYYTAGHAYDSPCSNWKTGKTGYIWESYKWCNGSYNTLTKYCHNSAYGTVDNKTVLEPADDAARQNWGDNWRMPTLSELIELYENCTWEWITQNNVVGHKVIGTNGNWIFLPAAGDRDGANLDGDGSVGAYWSSTRYYNPSGAYDLGFVGSQIIIPGSNYSSRLFGRCVRPVTE